MSLIKSIHKEMDRCRELKKLYNGIPAGFIGASMIDLAIKGAEKAIEENDPIEMLMSYEELKKIKG